MFERKCQDWAAKLLALTNSELCELGLKQGILKQSFLQSKKPFHTFLNDDYTISSKASKRVFEIYNTQ